MHRTWLLALVLVATAGSTPATPPPITALASFEVVADGFGKLRGIAIDADDRLYVADREAGTVTRIGDDGRRIVARRLERPVGLALDPLGRLLVAEERGGRIVRLDPNGPTTLVQGIKQPRWLAVGEDGTLYISARRLTRDADPEPDDESAEPEVILALTADGALSVFADGFDHLQGVAVRRDTVYAVTTGPRGPPRQGGVVYAIAVTPDGSAGRLARVGPRDVVERPVGVAIDHLGALFVSAPVASVNGSATRQSIVKLHADDTASAFASWLEHPRGLAFDSRGNLYVADGNAGRVLRFAAPPPPTLLGPPAFVRQPSAALAGTTVPLARVDVFVGAALMPVTTMASGSGSFAVSVTLTPNLTNTLEAFATAARGQGLTSAASDAAVVHDAIAPTLVLQAPPAGAFVRGVTPVRVDADDPGSQLASLSIGAAEQTLTPTLDPPLPAPAASALASWVTTTAADGTQTLIATATDRAGNPATVSRTVIVDNTAPETEITSGPSGAIAQPAATFTFAGSDNLTPATSLLFAWRLDGAPWTAYAPTTSAPLGNVPPGPHVFEVVARDLAGNEDPTPARRTFSVNASGPVLAITTPPAGATVASRSVIVRGTVMGGGAAVGVSVNDVPAFLVAGQWAAEVSIAPGDNVLTAVARDASGAETTAAITVVGIDPVPGVSLRASPSSGVAPLHVAWQVVSHTSRPLVQLELDERGDGAFGPAISTLEGAQSIYPVAGLMFPTVRATDDQGNVHVATTIVEVVDAQTATSNFQTLWAEFTARLQAGDQAGALARLAPSLRTRFERVFQQLGTALPGIAAALGPIHLIDQIGNLAEAAQLQVEDGVTRLYFVYFRRDNRGQWLIQDM